MKCSTVGIQDFGNRVFNTVRGNPKRSLAFALGTILLLTGIIGHLSGMNTLAVGVLTASSGPVFAAFIVSLVCNSESSKQKEASPEKINYERFEETPEFWDLVNEEAPQITDLEMYYLSEKSIQENICTSPMNEALVDENWSEFTKLVMTCKKSEDFQKKEEDFFQLTTLHFLVLSKQVGLLLLFHEEALKLRVNLLNSQASKEGGCYTPLHLAVKMNDLQMVGWLLRLQPDLTVQDAQGMTPLVLAKNLGHKECAELIANKPKLCEKPLVECK